MRIVMAVTMMWLLLAGGVASAQTSPSSSVSSGPFSLSGEALIWWFKNSPTPVPLITDGLLNQPGTNVLLGGGDANTNPHPGFRVTAGYALNERWGLEGSYFYLSTRSTSQSVASPGTLDSTDLLLPYFDVNQNRWTATEISLSPFYRGSAQEELSNNLMGAEASGTWAIAVARPWRLELLGGFRWLRLHETLTFTTSSPFIPPIPVDIWNTTDKFDAFNNFYGAQLGVRARFDWGRWFANGAVKFGMGAMRQTVNVSGFLETNDFTNFGSPQIYQGGYFALPSNIGNHTRTVFAVLPEVGVNVGFQITPWASIVLGYTFLYTNNVARPGNQINPNLNTTQSVSWVGDTTLNPTGPAQPSFKFQGSSFWAQGINVGLNFRF
ncbi:MAG TPA: BBP7 family outer membrane beta-barrel protein [Candidatus Methylomirabilis sp.]|nr:BBP7 family outer membrane beta-barrel protein [Candidatus Methylomirabilis sp.]